MLFYGVLLLGDLDFKEGDGGHRVRWNFWKASAISNVSIETVTTSAKVMSGLSI